MPHSGSSSQWQHPSYGPAIHFPEIQHLPAAEEESNHGCVEDDEILKDSSSAIYLNELEVGSDFAKLRQNRVLLAVSLPRLGHADRVRSYYFIRSGMNA
jgi:hypothetical protein